MLKSELSKAIELILNNKIVAVPTETVYGLAANACSDDAVRKIYDIKNRPTFNPLICHFHSIEQIKEYVIVSPIEEFLLQNFSPGPITLILPLKDNSPISKLVTCELDTLAVRIPNHPVMLKILSEINLPLAAPSANSSGMISPTSKEHVEKDLGNKVSMIMEYNCPTSTKIGIESTICMLQNNKINILRPGFITKQEIESRLKIGKKDNISVNYMAMSKNKIIHPGQLLKHYSTKKPIRINTCSNFNKDEFVISFGSGFPNSNLNLSKKENLTEAAANLFEYLYIADNDQNFSKIAVTPIPNIGIGIAINDRLSRAAGKETTCEK